MSLSFSHKNVIKDKRSLIYEILYSLEGIVGDLVFGTNDGSNRLELSDSSVNESSIRLSEINLINRLLETANNYIRINHFVEKYSSDSNSYNRRLAQIVDKLLVDYRNDLIECEKDINRDSDYSLFKFNQFFKYSKSFEFLNEMISQFNEKESSFGSTLDLLTKSSLSGFTQIQKCAKIVYESSDSLYSDIWSWIVFGFLSQKTINEFFIKEKANQVSELDMSLVPTFMSPIDAIKVHKIGETVRSAQRRGVSVQCLYSNRENELFQRFCDLQNEVSVNTSAFSHFIEFVRSIVSEYTWNYVVNEHRLKYHLNAIKNFYLTANDNFWSTFVFQTSTLVLNGEQRYQKDIEKAFDTSLRQVFNDSSVNEILSQFSITASKEANNYSIYLNYKIPVSLQNILSNDSIDKYNKIMNFMAKLYSSRFQLNQIWFKTMKSKLNSMKASNFELKVWSLRNCLSFIINSFYYYFKIDVIERLFHKFMDKVDKTKDIEQIQKEHQILLMDIIGQTFLKTCVVNKCLEQLFCQCNRFKSCLESEDSLNQLIEDFDRTKAQIYHLVVNVDNYKTNKLISNLVLELEKCSKQQIVFN